MMKTTLTLALAMIAGLASLPAPASACAPGYHKVWIQGNPVCAHNVGGNGQIKANTGVSNAQLQLPRSKRGRGGS